MSNSLFGTVLALLGLRAKGSEFDDSIRPISPAGNPKGAEWDDSIRPARPDTKPNG